MDENLTKHKQVAHSNKVRALCFEGYQLFDQKQHKSALRKFYQAWTLLPKPQTQWQEATWVLTAIGDAYHAKGEYNNAIEALSSALHCPDGTDNPLIHLRLAQCYQQLGDDDAAKVEFISAAQSGGKQFIIDNAPEQLHLLGK